MRFSFHRRTTTLRVVLLCAVPIAGIAQPSATFDLTSKLHFHAESVYSPWSVTGSAAYAGLLQEIGTPEEWGQGGGAYGRRFASTVACSGIHAVLAFGLDSTLHQDPRYSRSRSRGFWRRTAHAFRGTILTRTDRGGDTLSTWRLGSAYGVSPAISARNSCRISSERSCAANRHWPLMISGKVDHEPAH